MRAVILNGGSSKRFGEDKSEYLIGTKPMIEHVYERLSKVFNKVVLVGKPYKGLQYVRDRYSAGPLGGVLTAIEIFEDDLFVVGCDMPFILPDVVESMICLFEAEKTDAVVPRLSDGIHPLHAIYSRTIKENLVWSMVCADSSFRVAFDHSKVLYITEDFFREIPNWKWSFVNINTKSDLKFLEVAGCSYKLTR